MRAFHARRDVQTGLMHLTALGPEGNTYIEHHGQTTYKSEIKHLETLLNHYLQTGTMLETADPGPHPD